MKNFLFQEKEFRNALLNINRIKASEIFKQKFLESSNFQAIEKLVTITLEEIGSGWEKGEYSLAQVYISGVICEELIDQYLPKTDTQRKDLPKIAIGVLQDQHALGKRIVYSVVRSSGYSIIDFGQGLSVDELVEKTLESQINVLLISTLMLPSALKIKEVRKKINMKDMSIKIIVGGAPFRMDKELWKTVEADANGKNATNVIKIIEKVVKT